MANLYPKYYIYKTTTFSAVDQRSCSTCWSETGVPPQQHMLIHLGSALTAAL